MRRVGVAVVARRRRLATHPQMAGDAVGTIDPVVVDDAHLVALHGDAGRPRTNRARPIREEDVRHLGRADAIEDLDAEAIVEAVPGLGGKRLGR